jgi:hypothetical protein
MLCETLLFCSGRVRLPSVIFCSGGYAAFIEGR